ncbi:hypothetical protein QW180_02975 [Vibrio sinaloensis]|nr:hypothetical protein [Vibrio sinaloensis]
MPADLKFALLALLAIALVAGCGSESNYTVEPQSSVNAYGFDYQTGTLPLPKEPAENPATEEKVSAWSPSIL